MHTMIIRIINKDMNDPLINNTEGDFFAQS
jgi:hypothetical protein